MAGDDGSTGNEPVAAAGRIRHRRVDGSRFPTMRGWPFGGCYGVSRYLFCTWPLKPPLMSALPCSQQLSRQNACIRAIRRILHAVYTV
jgi:hypothetical protein